jgi:hypothetical protein
MDIDEEFPPGDAPEVRQGRRRITRHGKISWEFSRSGGLA